MEQEKQILLVVSHTATRKLIKTALLAEGYLVSESDNGKDALHLATTTKPNLIIQDILLPDYDGVKLCHTFHTLPGLENVPVIALVGFLNHIEQIKKLHADFSAVIIKPIYAKTLMQYVKKYFHASKLDEDAAYIDPFRMKLQLSLFYTLTNLLATNRRNLDHALEEVLGITLDSAGVNKGFLFLKNKQNKWCLRQFVGYLSKDREAIESLFENFSQLTEFAKQEEIIKIDENNLNGNIKELIKKINISKGLIIPIFVKQECHALFIIGTDQENIDLHGQDSLTFASFIAKHIGHVTHSASIDNQLHITDQRLHAIMEHVSCGVFLLDHHGVIVDVNMQAEKIFGHSHEEMMGKTYLNFIVADEIHSVGSIIDKLLIDKRIGPAVIKIKQASGLAKEIGYTIMAANINDERMYLVVLNDISETEQLRRQVLLNDKLATMGTLAAGIVHEINNPVSWVLVNLNFLKERIKKFEANIEEYPTLKKLQTDPVGYLAELKKEINYFNELAMESVEGMQQIKEIVQDLKGFTRADERNETLCDIHEIINSTLRIASPHYKNKVTIEKYFTEDLPKFILERGKIQQVILNLIVNAIQCISDRTECDNILQIKTYVNNNKVCVDVSDNGPGINPEILPKIFDPFFTTKPVGVGTGLGLSICKEIIDRAGGDILVKTEVGKGTTFTLSLPLRLAEGNKISSKITSANHVLPARILVIDDEPTLLKTVQRVLESHHHITLAHGGQLALDLLHQCNYGFDIIITDLSMPVVSGIDIYMHIVQNAPGLEKHIIFMTGGATTQSAKQFLNNVNNVCIPKPFTKEELLQAVAAIPLPTS